MADERVVHSMKIVDPTTTSQIAGVASLTDNFSNPTAIAVGAFNMVWDGSNWDRLIQIVAALDSAGAGIPAVGIVGQFDDTSPAAVTENQFAPVRISTRRALLVEGVASGVAITVDSELPAAAALTDDFANPTVPGVGAFLMGWDGTDWDRVAVTDNGRLQVDVITGGGSNTPTSPVTEITNSANTAAGSSANLDTSDLGGQTRELWQVVIAASVPWKAVIGAYENGSLVENYVTLFGKAGENVIWEPAHTDFANEAFSANAGFDGFRAVVTNLDTSEAADLYASFQYADG